MFASLVGVFSIWKTIGQFIEKNLRYFVSFSAGVFMIISISLAVEAIEHSTLFFSLLWILIGAIFMILIFKVLPNFHHHHDKSENHTHDQLDARRIIASDAIHNIGDGVLLAVSFSSGLGLVTAASIFIHELVQEISEFFVLRQAGLRIKKILIINFIISGTILVGSLGGYFLIDSFEIIEVPLLAISAGAFFVVVLNDLIPQSIRHSNTEKKYFNHIVAFLLGLLLMNFVSGLTEHSHNHQDHDSDHHEEEDANF